MIYFGERFQKLPPKLKLTVSRHTRSKVLTKSILNVVIELDDLIRLHYLVTSRKVMTILEFGVGKSSIVFDHALQIN